MVHIWLFFLKSGGRERLAKLGYKCGNSDMQVTPKPMDRVLLGGAAADSAGGTF